MKEWGVKRKEGKEEGKSNTAREQEKKEREMRREREERRKLDWWKLVKKEEINLGEGGKER